MYHSACARQVVRATPLLLVLACTRPSADAVSADTAGSDTALGAAGARVDTTSGDWAIADPERQFLRIMADHHQGLIALARTAHQRSSDADTRDEARRLADRHTSEQAEMLALLESGHDDTHEPMPTPSAKAMDDSLRRTPPADMATAFHEAALAHYRSDLVVIERYLPSLTGPNARALAQRMLEEVIARAPPSPPEGPG